MLSAFESTSISSLSLVLSITSILSFSNLSWFFLFFFIPGFPSFRDLGTKAPTGHTETQFPQDTQVECSSPFLNGVLIRELNPLSSIVIASVHWSSLQTLTHLPQSIHLLGS